jgi:hypothetical protein
MVMRACLLAAILLAIYPQPPTFGQWDAPGSCESGTCPTTQFGPLVPIQRRQTPAQKPEKVPRNVVRVLCEHDPYTKYTTGTQLQDGWIVTCAHGLRTGWNVRVRFHDGSTYPVKPEDVHIDDGNDMAVLRIPMEVAERYRAIRLESGDYRPGSTVGMAGFGGGHYTTKAGKYSHRQNDWVIVRGTVHEGDSGGPIFLPDGGLIGIIAELEVKPEGNEVGGCSAERIAAFLEEIKAAAEDPAEQPSPESEVESEDNEEYVVPEVNESVDIHDELPRTEFPQEDEDVDATADHDDSEITPDVDETDDSEAEADVDESEESPPTNPPSAMWLPRWCIPELRFPPGQRWLRHWA